MEIVLLISGLLVDIVLLVLVFRQGAAKHLPWFTTYVAWGVLLPLAQIAARAVSLGSYVSVYWWTEAVAIVLIVGAVRESFLRIFEGFTSKAGFRGSVWTVIGGVVIYSAWKAIYAPPLQSNRLTVFVFGAEFLFRWAIFGIALLTTIFGFLFKEAPDTREEAVVAGFGVASMGFLIYVTTFSVFGTKYTIFTKYVPSVAYFVAAFWWIRVFARPVQEFGFQTLGIGPEDMARVLRRYRSFGERL